MTESDLLLTIGGIYNLGFAVFHLFFWKVFRWKEDLTRLTRINRAIMQILNLCLTFIFVVMAYVSFAFQPELTTTNLGKTLLVSFSLFWSLRTIEQVVFFSVRHKTSLALTFFFLIGSALYLLPVF
jgi:hypothetical protein